MVEQRLQTLPDSPLRMEVASYKPNHEEKGDSANDQPLDYSDLVVDQSRLASNP